MNLFLGQEQILAQQFSCLKMNVFPSAAEDIFAQRCNNCYVYVFTNRYLLYICSYCTKPASGLGGMSTSFFIYFT
jgi:hypothetical protein